MSATAFQLTVRRRDSLALVRSDLVGRDLEQGCWLINGSPARRWHGRTLSELEQAGLIEIVAGVPAAAAAAAAVVALTDAGRDAVAR